MHKILSAPKFKAFAVSIFASFIVVSPVFAKPPKPFVPTPTATPTPTPAPTPFVRPSTFIQSGVRLSGAQLTVCQAHERVIQNRLNSLTRMANNMLATFDNIESRVVDYYKTKLLAKGQSIAKYDELISDIQKKQAAVQNVLKATTNDANDFLCTGIDPKGHLTQFRIDMQEVKKSLKEYRTAIKNLIVAVHSVAEKVTPTPKK